MSEDAKNSQCTVWADQLEQALREKNLIVLCRLCHERHHGKAGA